MGGCHSASQRLKHINRDGRPCVTRLQQIREVKGRLLRQHWPHRFGHATDRSACGLGFVRAKGGERCLAGNGLPSLVVDGQQGSGERQQTEASRKGMGSPVALATGPGEG